MKNILVIGAGQLGSRHLQGLLKSKYDYKVYVVDPSEISLNICKQRSNEIQHNKSIIFVLNLESIPRNIYFAIISTSSLYREQIIYKLLKKFDVKYFLLEKVLFPNLEAYQKVNEHFHETNSRVWVNHPRRILPFYAKLKRKCEASKSINFSLSGGNWGLACNGLHYIDLFCFLSNSQLESIDTGGVENKLMQSKREGYLEFSGTIKGNLINGNRFEITSSNNDDDCILQIEFGTCYIEINETKKEALFQDDIDIPIFNKVNFEIELQSELTNTIIEKIIEKQTCDLVEFEFSSNTHYIFISELLKKYNTITGQINATLPIT